MGLEVGLKRALEDPAARTNEWLIQGAARFHSQADRELKSRRAGVGRRERTNFIVYRGGGCRNIPFVSCAMVEAPAPRLVSRQVLQAALA